MVQSGMTLTINCNLVRKQRMYTGSLYIVNISHGKIMNRRYVLGMSKHSSQSESLPFEEIPCYFEDMIEITYLASVVAEQCFEGTEAPSSGIEYQIVMLTQVLEMLREMCPITYALDPHSSCLVKTSRDVLCPQLMENVFQRGGLPIALK